MAAKPDTGGGGRMMLQRWKCSVCNHVYMPEEGDPEGGVPRDTPFEKIPADWVCPECGSPRSAYKPLK
jgi:rubredoxin